MVDFKVSKSCTLVWMPGLRLQSWMDWQTMIVTNKGLFHVNSLVSYSSDLRYFVSQLIINHQSQILVLKLILVFSLHLLRRLPQFCDFYNICNTSKLQKTWKWCSKLEKFLDPLPRNCFWELEGLLYIHVWQSRSLMRISPEKWMNNMCMELITDKMSGPDLHVFTLKLLALRNTLSIKTGLKNCS